MQQIKSLDPSSEAFHSPLIIYQLVVVNKLGEQGGGEVISLHSHSWDLVTHRIDTCSLLGSVEKVVLAGA